MRRKKRSTANMIYAISICCLILTNCSDDTITNNDRKNTPDIGVAGDGKLSEILEYTRSENYVPALTALLYKDGKIIELASVGTTTENGTVNVSQDSKWHLGSITKSMTSTLAGILVERGDIKWTSTIIDIFPEYNDVIFSKYGDINLSELLTHTSGIGEIDLSEWEGVNTDLIKHRIEVAGEGLTTDYDLTRGVMSYSNLGYIIAGAMLERVTNISWEDLIIEHIFTPLEMSNSGFAAPIDTISPWGHSPYNGDPINPTNSISDNPMVLGPAGTIHSTLNDMAKYLELHIQNTNALIADSTFTKLHTGVVEMPNMDGLQYAYGWNATPDNQLMFHSGSNTMWLAQATVNHHSKVGIFVATNIWNDDAQKAIDLATDYIIQREIALSN